MQATIIVYLDDGRTFNYPVVASTTETVTAKAKEHAAAIVKAGYYHFEVDLFEHYPPHRILKVKATGIGTVPADLQDKSAVQAAGIPKK